jgi:hypothetical protein
LLFSTETVILNLLALLASILAEIDVLRNNNMNTSYDYEFLQSITWYAVDVDRRIAAFDLGSMPQSALALASQWEAIDTAIRAMPEVSDYRLLIDRSDFTATKIKGICQESREAIANVMMQHRERIISELPRHGIYQFEGMPSPYGQLPSKYRLVGIPLSPIELQCLPDQIKYIVDSMALKVRFSEIVALDVSQL